jgi:hypothetical protein
MHVWLPVAHAERQLFSAAQSVLLEQPSACVQQVCSRQASHVGSLLPTDPQAMLVAPSALAPASVPPVVPPPPDCTVGPVLHAADEPMQSVMPAGWGEACEQAWNAKSAIKMA